MKFGYYSDRGLPESEYGYRCPKWDPMPMGKKNVIVLGCSHTYGVGLEDNEHWVHFLSQHNPKLLRYWNLGQPGASGDKIVRILYGTQKLLDPKIIIVCWPVWSRRERLDSYPKSLTSDDETLKLENDHTDKNNFLKNVFLVEKFGENVRAKVFHCFAEELYDLDLPNVLKNYTIKNCWPYWDSRTQRELYPEPVKAKDGLHYGEPHHKRFAEVFIEALGPKLK